MAKSQKRKSKVLRKGLKTISTGLLVLFLIISQAQVFSAYEAHVINVLATIHKLDDPVFYPTSQGFCTMEEGVDVVSTDPDDAPVVVHYEVGEGTLDPTSVPDPTCSSPAGSGDPSTAHITINQTDTVIKAITCTADGLHQGRVVYEIYHYDENLCPCDCDDVYINTVMTGTNFDFNGQNVHIQNGGEIRGACTDVIITTNCDLIIEPGGKITHNGGSGSSGKNIKINVGKDMTVNGSIEANGGSGWGTQYGGKIEINVSGNTEIGSTGIIEANAQENGGQVVIKNSGLMSVAQGGKVTANSSTGEYGDNGGLIAMEIGDNLTINGLIQANGQYDDGGRITASVVGDLNVGFYGNLEAKSAVGNSDTDNGGSIALKVAGDFNMSGTINASGVRRGGRISLWSAKNINFGVSGQALANGGSGSYTQYGGQVYIISQKKLTLGKVEAKSSDVAGSIFLVYCTNDFGGKDFNPTPTELTSCPSDILLNEIMPNPSGSDTGNIGLPLNDEWVELYNSGASSVDVNGWYLYDYYNTHALQINSSRVSGGNTVIPAGSVLMVYRNGDLDFSLDDNGDAVRLYNGTISSGASLMDSFVYLFNLGEDNSYARIPNGSGPWYDPEPTPGLPNVLNSDNDYTLLWEEIGADNVIDPEEPVEPEAILGCTDLLALNYNPEATEDDGSCIYEQLPMSIPGCTDQTAQNYNPEATADDGSCTYEEQPVVILGCTDELALNYNAEATEDDGSCTYEEEPVVILGCMDETALNYNPEATEDDSTCTYEEEPAQEPEAILGCTDQLALNYNAEATEDDGSCTYQQSVMGCTDPGADNYNPEATEDDGSCTYPILGCTDPMAENFNTNATKDDGSCTYPILGCMDPAALNHNPDATDEDGSCIYPEPEPEPDQPNNEPPAE